MLACVLNKGFQSKQPTSSNKACRAPILASTRANKQTWQTQWGGCAKGGLAAKGQMVVVTSYQILAMPSSYWLGRHWLGYTAASKTLSFQLVQQKRIACHGRALCKTDLRGRQVGVSGLAVCAHCCAGQAQRATYFALPSQAFSHSLVNG